MTRLGFTGSRQGMTTAQVRTVRDILKRASVLHHGGAQGADRTVAAMAHAQRIAAVLHRPTGHRAEDYLRRNHDIVDATDELVAAPAGYVEEPRSGTWATVRYARQCGRFITIVWPDGTIGPG